MIQDQDQKDALLHFRGGSGWSEDLEQDFRGMDGPTLRQDILLGCGVGKSYIRLEQPYLG